MSKDGLKPLVEQKLVRRIRWEGDAPDPIPSPPWLAPNCIEVIEQDLRTGERRTLYSREAACR